MLVVPRLLQHTHSGRLAHHGETSYALLLFLTLGVGVLLASVTWGARASFPSMGTLCGEGGGNCIPSTYAVSAVVPAARPSQPAIITSPTSGQTFSTNPVTVSGTCPSGSLVKIFTNGILVGSEICQNGHFSVPVDLVIGRNDLTALPYNLLDQAGPTSPTVTVTLNQPPGGPGFSTELILQSVNYYRGTTTGTEITWPIDIIGGQAPYAVSIDWGDGTQDVITRLAPGPFTVSHTYKKPGGYLGSFPLIIRAADAAGHTAYLQLTTIVNDATGSTTKASGKPQVNQLLIIWPLWIVILLMIISFWLGERREKRIMEKKLAALA
jgi:hypothetical protein